MFANKVILQLQREIWEYRVSFFWVPLVAMVIPAFIIVMMFYWGPHSSIGGSGGFEIDGVHFKDFVVPSQAGREAYFDFGRAGAFEFFAKFVLAISWLIYSIIYIICALNFAFSCLYLDRKSNSILFWRSLPVSETRNFLGKLLVICCLIPMALTVLLALCVGLILTGGALVAGDVGLLVSLGKHVSVSPVVAYSMSFFWSALLFLPFATWALFMSALVKQNPGVIGIILPLLLWMIDEMLQRLLGFGLGIQALIKGYGGMINEYLSSSNDSILGWIFNAHFGKIFLVSIVVAMLFSLATVWLRNNRYET